MATHSISMQGIGAQYLSAKKGATGTVGYPCHFSASSTVVNTARNGTLVGVIVGVRGSLVAVRYRGFVTLPYSGSAPSIGYSILVADGSGGVKTAQSGVSYLVASVDSSAKTVCILL